MSSGSDTTAHPPSAFVRSARRILRFALRSPHVRLALFIATVLAAGHFARPWGVGWVRMDEAEEVAETFLLRQGADLQEYTQVRALAYERGGAWSARDGELRYACAPAVAYRFRYFQPHKVDGWTISVAPTGQIFRIRRDQLEDEPGRRLERGHALELVRTQLANNLLLPADSLELTADTLITQFQRNDWVFEFRWPSGLDSTERITATLSGEALTDVSFKMRSERQAHLTPARTPKSRRLLSFVVILGGVFLIMHYHRTPLALKSAGIWGAVLFLLVLSARALTFPQALILIPWDSPVTGYLSRVGLSALVEAIQYAFMLGLVVATGEALSRDVFRRSSSLTRLAPGLPDWRAAWARAARWAMPAAAMMLIVETVATHYLGPVGLIGKVPQLLADTMSSPAPVIALPVQVALDVVWEESVYRLWTLSLLLFWLRLPVLAIPLAAAAAAYFAGFDFAQLTSAGGLFYIAWGVVTGWLMWRIGIFAAMLFHLSVLGGYAAMTLYWSHFGAGIGIGMLLTLAGLVAALAWDRRDWEANDSAAPPLPPPRLEIFGSIV